MRKNRKLLKSFVEFLKEQIPGFINSSESHQHQMADLIWQCDLKIRRHNKLDGRIFISCKELRDRFGRDGFKRMNDCLNIFDITNNWDHKNHLGKGYKLTDEFKELKNKFLGLNKNELDSITYTTKTGGIRIMRGLLDAISHEDDEGREPVSWRQEKILNLTPIDMDAMSELRKYLEDVLSQDVIEGNDEIGYDAEEIEYRLMTLLMLRKYGCVGISGYGNVMITYSESRSGRLYADDFSLQTVPRLVRNAALNGLYDYDIENCHFDIFSQLCDQFGYKTDGINSYLENKEKCRNDISQDIGITIKQAKTCLLMFLYGARKSDREENSIPEEIGREKAKLFYKHPIVDSIYNDVKTGRKLIIDGWTRVNKVYLLNNLNKGISHKATNEEKLAHIIQGIEAKALREVVRLYPYGICLLMHDGFVSTKELDIALIESKIKEATGFDLSISHKKLEFKLPK